jgi:hypothetical protein
MNLYSGWINQTEARYGERRDRLPGTARRDIGWDGAKVSDLLYALGLSR